MGVEPLHSASALRMYREEVRLLKEAQGEKVKMFYRGGRIINVNPRPDMMAINVRVEYHGGRIIDYSLMNDEWRFVESRQYQEREEHRFYEERVTMPTRGEFFQTVFATIGPGGSGSPGGSGGGGGAGESEIFYPDQEDEIAKFPEYTEEKFEGMTKKPVIKEIMPGMVKLTKEQRLERIKLYLQEK